MHNGYVFFPCKFYSWYIPCVGDMYWSIYVVYALYIIIYILFPPLLKYIKEWQNQKPTVTRPLQSFFAMLAPWTPEQHQPRLYMVMLMYSWPPWERRPDDRVRKAALGSRKFTLAHSLWLSNIAMNNSTFIWLVVSTPLKNMSSPVGMMTFPTEWKS